MEDEYTIDLKPDEIKGFYEEETYTKGLSREETIERQVRIASFFYSKGIWHEFEYSVKMLVALLPRALRDTFSIPDHNTKNEGIECYYNLFVNIQTKLEEDTNLIFKKKFIKTFK